LEHVFKTLNLARVIYVDDVFQQEVGQVVRGEIIESFVRARTLDEGLFAELLPDVPLDVPDVWVQEAASYWEEADFDERARIAAGLESIIGETKATLDFTASEELQSILPQSVEFIKVAPNEWPRRRDELKTSAPTNRILCLFDVNLGNAEGEGRAYSGIDLLSEALQLDGAEDVFFGLFSTQFTIDNELNEWRSIAKDYPTLSGFKGRFLPLAKARKDDLVQFAKGLEMMTLNTFCDRLKELGCHALTQAHEGAVQKIKAVEVFDFEQIVLAGSFSEGASEADTFFRLFHIFHRDDTKRNMLEGDSVSDFNENVSIAREIRAKRVGGDQHPPHQRLELRHQELYEAGVLLNRFHSPLRSGDIFRNANGSKWYVLLAPPCNLAVRSDGKRRVSRVTLVPIRLQTKHWLEDKRSATPEYLETRGILKYLRPPRNLGEEWMWGIVEFVDAGGINANVLDLATLNEDGFCTIDISREARAPTQMHSAWKTHVDRVVSDWAAVHKRLEEFENLIGSLPADARKKLWSALMPVTADPVISLKKDCVEGTTFQFGLQRILHYRDPYSSHLLNDFTRYISRTATPFDFGTELR